MAYDPANVAEVLMYENTIAPNPAAEGLKSTQNFKVPSCFLTTTKTYDASKFYIKSDSDPGQGHIYFCHIFPEPVMSRRHTLNGKPVQRS